MKRKALRDEEICATWNLTHHHTWSVKLSVVENKKSELFVNTQLKVNAQVFQTLTLLAFHSFIYVIQYYQLFFFFPLEKNVSVTFCLAPERNPHS